MRGRPVLMTTCAVILGTAPAPVGAQTTDDEALVLATIEQVFEGMRTADPAKVRAAFAADARFAMVDARNGPTRVAVQPVDGWIESIGRSEGRWDEQIYDVVILVDGPMASAWVPYTFYLDGALRHCGINSIELLRDEGGWRLTQLSDTRRTEGCPDPLGGGPAGSGS